jgi:hypothetical protein
MKQKILLILSFAVLFFYFKGWAKDSTKVSKKLVINPIDSSDSEAISFQLVFRGSLIKGLDENVIHIPFRLSGNLLLVEAELNGITGWFILDSGAPDLKINSRHLAHSFTAETKANTAGGITGTVTQVSLQTIESFNWHTARLKNARIESFDLGHIEAIKQEKILGLIGFKLFRDFEVLLDFKNADLILYRLDDEGNRLDLNSKNIEPQHQIPFQMIGHVPILRGKIGKYYLNFALDTGAELNVMDVNTNPRALEMLTIKRRFLLSGNGQEKVEAFMGNLSELQIGNLRYTNMRTVLTNLNAMNKAYNADLDGILGFEFFSRNKTAINFPKQMLYIWEKEKQ